MRVYLIEKDNGETYEDYHTHIDGAFTTYRGATESLLSEGYKPHLSIDFISGDIDVHFNLKVVEGELTEEEMLEVLEDDRKRGIESDVSDHYYGYEMHYGANIIEIELQGETK